MTTRKYRSARTSGKGVEDAEGKRREKQEGKGAENGERTYEWFLVSMSISQYPCPLDFKPIHLEDLYPYSHPVPVDSIRDILLRVNAEQHSKSLEPDR